MKELVELKPEDLIVKLYNKQCKGGMHIAQVGTGVEIYHKTTGSTFKCDRYKSQHKNKNACIVALQDSLTEREVGDIVYYGGEGYKEYLVTSINRSTLTLEDEDGWKSVSYRDQAFLTKQGWTANFIKVRESFIKELEEDILKYKRQIEGMVE